MKKGFASHARRYSAAFWLVGALVLIGAVWLVGFPRIRAAASAVDMRWFAAMTLLEGAALWWRAFKWRYVLGRGASAFGLYFLSKAAGNFTPGRVGELSPLLMRRHRNVDVGAWIVADRMLESSSTLLFGMTGMALLELPIHSALAAIGVIAFIAGMTAVLVVKRRAWMGLLSQRIAKHVAALIAALERLKGVLLIVGLMTLAGTAIELAGNVLLYRSFGYGVSFPAAAAAKVAHGLVGAMPMTPSPTGMPHVATGLVINKAAGVPVDAVVAALTLQVVAVNIVFWLSFALGMLDLRKTKTSTGGA